MKTGSAPFLALLTLFSLQALGVERKSLEDVNVAAMAQETQKFSNHGGVHLAWWIPPEYWEASVSQNPDMPKKSREDFMKLLRKYSMLVVTQAETSPFGTFSFYDRAVIVKGMKIELWDGKDWSQLQPVEKIPDDLQTVLKVMAPILQGALGKLGENLQFFVLDDEVKGKRLISPYDASKFRVSLTAKSGESIAPFEFEMPLDSLFVPRTCPNGKPAQVSWVVCPWDGTALPK
jgi:hypothetical protein